MNYYEQDDRRGRMWGIIGVVLYLALCVAVMFISYRIALPETEQGILIDFGASDTGGGDVDTALSEEISDPSVPITETSPTEPVMTTDLPDAPEIAPQPDPKPVPRNQTSEPAPEPVREVNPRALFPGRTERSTSSSQGATEGEGNQGSQNGAPAGTDSEGGSGSSGFSLSGRYLVGNLPRPAYNADVEGRVVIRITVNGEGAVTGAVFEQTGSTTNHGELVGAARAAAMKARFTPSEAEIQSGTITYIFRLN